MANFTDVLKVAVEQQDWQIICCLYTTITGEPLSIPAHKEPSVLDMVFDIDSLVPNDGGGVAEQVPVEEEKEEEIVYDIGDSVWWQASDTTKYCEWTIVDMIHNPESFTDLEIQRVKGHKKKYKVDVLDVDPTDMTLTLASPQHVEQEPEPEEQHGFIVSTRGGSNDGGNLDELGRLRNTNDKGQLEALKASFNNRPNKNNNWADDKTEALVDEDGNSLLVSKNKDAGTQSTVRQKVNRVYKKINVKCRDCKRRFDVSPAFSYGFVEEADNKPIEECNNTWVCDSCNSPRARRERAKLEREALDSGNRSSRRVSA